MKTIKELLRSLRGAADVAYSEDICLYLTREDCAAAADEIDRLCGQVSRLEDYANRLSDSSNEEAKREKRVPNISFPTPKGEPNLPSAYIFPREPNGQVKLPIPAPNSQESK